MEINKQMEIARAYENNVIVMVYIIEQNVYIICFGKH